MKQIRQAIMEDRLLDFRNEFLQNMDMKYRFCTINYNHFNI